MTDDRTPQTGESLSCPSAQPDMQDVRILGVIEGDGAAARIAYLAEKEAVDPRSLQGVDTAFLPHVLRLSARCENARCAQFANGKCGLGERIAKALPDVVESLPTCSIRRSCRWYAEQGGAICLKCPQIVTLVPAEAEALAHVANPRHKAP